MNKVFLYGGVNSKLKHYKYATEVYEAYKYQVHFIQTKYNGASTFLPKVYRQQNEKIKHEDVAKCIIHTSSGGYWAGIEFNKIKKADSFIIENGPVPLTLEQFVDTTQKVYKFKYPKFVVDNIPAVMNSIGIPTPQYMPDFFKNMELITVDIQNCLLINGGKDKILNNKYLEDYINILKKNGVVVDSVYFPEGTHTKVHINNIQAYQDAIEKKIKSIV